MLDGGVHGAFVLISHGGFYRLRNTSELLRALSLLPERFRLTMTNSQSPHAEFDALLTQFNLHDRVVRLPRLPFTEMLRYTANADLGVLLYTKNDLGNYFQAPGRLYEYMANGIPVLASNFAGLESLIHKHQIGVTVDQDAESIAAGILEAENNSPKATHIRSVFEKHLAFNFFAPDAVAVFRSLKH
jgi:glycosyltransferase involved in cell wall biosynthesis